jgi:hypothetical protein
MGFSQRVVSRLEDMRDFDEARGEGLDLDRPGKFFAKNFSLFAQTPS